MFQLHIHLWFHVCIIPWDSGSLCVIMSVWGCWARAFTAHLQSFLRCCSAGRKRRNIRTNYRHYSSTSPGLRPQKEPVILYQCTLRRLNKILHSIWDLWAQKFIFWLGQGCSYYCGVRYSLWDSKYNNKKWKHQSDVLYICLF